MTGTLHTNHTTHQPARPQCRQPQYRWHGVHQAACGGRGGIIAAHLHDVDDTDGRVNEEKIPRLGLEPIQP